MRTDFLRRLKQKSMDDAENAERLLLEGGDKSTPEEVEKAW